MTLGYCASQKPEIAKRAIPYAKQYILEKVDGQLCLVGAIDKYLGKFGKHFVLFFDLLTLYGALIAYILGAGHALNAIFNYGNYFVYLFAFRALSGFLFK